MRKGFTQFTKEDFSTQPVWELQGSFTTAEPYSGKLPFNANKFRAFFVRTAFTLADLTQMTGWTMVCVPPYEIHSLSPTILTDLGPINLTKLARNPKAVDIDKAYKILRRPAERVFPLSFRTDVPIPKGPAIGTLGGFMHRHTFKDANGWLHHHYVFYRSIEELNTSLKVIAKRAPRAKF